VLLAAVGAPNPQRSDHFDFFGLRPPPPFVSFVIGKKLGLDFRLVPLLFAEEKEEEAGLVFFCRAKPARSALEDVVGRALLALREDDAAVRFWAVAG
jgi:hypothetical protein